ncbi:DHH family phosphoesterase [Tengunoibacter tsumagoiensis]|uniref:Phosphoesterase RecJ-like protein n=1 Tax=Tengunoibacter tsumagoiensis TaxID=2014871 RepID=A0A402A2S8_9CHLR|nr:bifunctional oligoribonuclease/PAP phosphatase NrnA [Tengunoibacter tsumagoiensis]GCE13447.1 phosphoesterase RecJ-like protein [Tengunoibacter tsumagoiensis]
MSEIVASSDFPLAQQQLPAAKVQQAMHFITAAKRIALLAHERPDGDCLGSALGFAHMLRQLGKDCVPACADPAPSSFSFLPDVETLQTTLGDEQFDLVIALDAGELSRYGALYEQHRHFLDTATIINIDHHVSSEGCGTVNIIETGAASTTELIVLFQQQAGLPLDKDAAICLLTGLITDSGSFQYPSTSARTMEVGAILLTAGATAEMIVKPLFRTRPLAQLRLQAATTNNIQTTLAGRVLWSYANDETLAQAGATADMDDAIVGSLRDIAGVQVAAFFKNYGDPSLTRVSLRSTAPYDVAAICMRLGGGGHPRAAGATIHQPLAEATRLVIQEIVQQIEATDQQLQEQSAQA